MCPSLSQCPHTSTHFHASKRTSLHHSVCTSHSCESCHKLSCAAFEDLRSKCFVQPDAAFAGHSLGEFSALASVADILPNSSLLDVVFYRGPTMQRAVEHDEQSRASYAICAVNPSRVNKTFDDATLREVVDTISNVGDS
jgi:malonyl CoA-acyl carrier protein transacylase